jgi:cysteine desulfurase
MIYLDNSATTRPCAAAALCMRAMLEESWFNPSALYGEAVRTEKRLNEARKSLSAKIGLGGALVFTGGGTEADSLAILGSAARFRGAKKVLLFAAEHPAVLQTAGQLRAMGHAVDLVPATGDGLIDLDALKALTTPDTALLSLMQVNNETGAVQPLLEASRILRAGSPGALLHVDGVQGFLRLPLNAKAAGVDLYTTSAHKVHGTKGVGALAMRPGVPLAARIAGGGQEGGLRSGTENTAGIAAFAAAADWVAEQADAPDRLRAMKLRLYEQLREGIPGLRVNGAAPNGDSAAPHILNVSFPGIGGEVMVHALERQGVLVGTGAACSSKKRAMSAAFSAMRAPAWAAASAVRFSFGLLNTPEEADAAAQAAIACYRQYKV